MDALFEHDLVEIDQLRLKGIVKAEVVVPKCLIANIVKYRELPFLTRTNESFDVPELGVDLSGGTRRRKSSLENSKRILKGLPIVGRVHDSHLLRKSNVLDQNVNAKCAGCIEIKLDG